MGRDVDAQFDVNGVLYNIRHSYLPDRANIYQAGWLHTAEFCLGWQRSIGREVRTVAGGNDGCVISIRATKNGGARYTV